MRPSEQLGDVVASLRARRLQGAALSELIRDLRQKGLDLHEAAEYLGAAFCLSGPLRLLLMPRDGSRELVPGHVDELFGPMVDETRSQWENAEAYPDLMRRRDRHAFRQTARRTGCVFVVRASNPFAGQHIGLPGFRPAPLCLLGVSRRTPPNAGLMAADPNDPRLATVLESLQPPQTYADFKAELDARGFTVSDEEEGHIVRDDTGDAFYPGYYLLGVYDEETGRNAWTGDEGEKIRAELNQRMGEELVRCGPHEAWDQRLALDETSPLRGPLIPALLFLPDGNVEVKFDPDSLESYYRYLGIRWGSLYPKEAASPEQEELP